MIHLADGKAKRGNHGIFIEVRRFSAFDLLALTNSDQPIHIKTIFSLLYKTVLMRSTVLSLKLQQGEKYAKFLTTAVAILITTEVIQQLYHVCWSPRYPAMTASGSGKGKPKLPRKWPFPGSRYSFPSPWYS